MTRRVQARSLPSGWLVGSTGPDGRTSILGPDLVVNGDWVRLIVAYCSTRNQAEMLVEQLNKRHDAKTSP